MDDNKLEFNNDYNSYGILRDSVIPSVNSTTGNTYQPSGISGILNNNVTNPINPTSITSGQIISQQTVAGGYLQSGNFVTGVSGWQLTPTSAEFPSIVVSGGTIRYGKTSFTDSANSGYYISSSGLYFGSASDATVLKYDIGSGVMTYAGNLVNSLGNTVISTVNQNILKDFSFGSTDFSGAVKSGTITWNTSTGAVTGGSGVLLFRGGIVGANSGVTTFVIDASTGNATFAGTLSGASGTFGTITAGVIDGCDVYANNFRNKRWTVNYGLNTTVGWETTTSGGATLTPYSSNIMVLSALDSLGASAIGAIEVGSFGIDLTTNATSPLNFSKNPVLECLSICTNLTGAGTAYLRMGQIDNSTSAYTGFIFDPANTKAAYHDGSVGAIINLSNSIDNSKWHKYRIEITPNGGNFDVKWYVDDALEASLLNHTFSSQSGKNFGARVSNNWVAGGDPDNAVMVIAAASFQQDY